MSVLAIDQGTSGTTAVVVDGGVQVGAVASVPVRPTHLPGGGVEQDPEQLWASVLLAGRRAVAGAGPAGNRIDAVALANQGETVLAWDRRTGAPLTTAIGWQDRRSTDICAELAPHADRLSGRTGLVLDPYFSAPKMAWLRRHLTADGVVTTTDSWLVHRLCGAFVTDVSTAGRSLLVDLDAADWDPELAELFGLADEDRPEIVACDEVVGRTGVFGGDAAVGGLVVDQQAALFAQRCHDRGAAKCTFGTGAFLLANTGADAVRSGAGLTTSAAWVVRGDRAYCLDGQVYTAASALRWLCDLGVLDTPTAVDAVAATDPGPVLCVPALAGLASPWWRPQATATLTGLSLGTGRGEIVRAVLDGIAAQVAEVLDAVAVDLGAPLTRLCVDGGLTASRTLLQILADLTQLPVDVYPHAEATALGAAALGRLAVEPALTPADAVPPWRPAASYDPRWAPGRADEFRARWRHALTRNPDEDPR